MKNKKLIKKIVDASFNNLFFSFFDNLFILLVELKNIH